MSSEFLNEFREFDEIIGRIDAFYFMLILVVSEINILF